MCRWKFFTEGVCFSHSVPLVMNIAGELMCVRFLLHQARIQPSMHLYTYLLKLQLLNALAYRFEYLSSIGRNLFFLLGSVFLWRTAYRGIDEVAGVTEAQMVTYAVVAVLMNACFTVSIDDVLLQRSAQVRSRSI